MVLSGPGPVPTKPSSNLPKGIAPNLDNPLTKIAITILNIFLGGLVIFTIGLFVYGLFSAVASLASKKREGAGGGAIMAFASLIFLGILFSVEAFIGGWLDVLG